MDAAEPPMAAGGTETVINDAAAANLARVAEQEAAEDAAEALAKAKAGRKRSQIVKAEIPKSNKRGGMSRGMAAPVDGESPPPKTPVKKERRRS